MKLNLFKRSEFEYVLQDRTKKTQGIITANYYGKDYIEIVRFCVAIKYRRNKEKYGKMLLSELIEEARNRNITRIEVIPKSFEEFDDIPEMNIETVCEIYEKHLGFKYVQNQIGKKYGARMVLNLK